MNCIAIPITARVGRSIVTTVTIVAFTPVRFAAAIVTKARGNMIAATKSPIETATTLSSRADINLEWQYEYIIILIILPTGIYQSL